MTLNKRYELKFVMDEIQAVQFERWMLAAGTKTAFPERIVHSIYLDDPHISAVSDNLSGYSERQKHRIRWYESSIQKQLEGSPVLEVKMKRNRMGSKRSVSLNIPSCSLGKWPNPQLNQELYRRCREAGISYMIRKQLLPMIHISYHRSYYVFSGIPGRITIDRSIYGQLIMHSQPYQKTLKLRQGKIVGEIKFGIGQEECISKKLKMLHLVPGRHSKYLAGLASFGLIQY